MSAISLKITRFKGSPMFESYKKTVPRLKADPILMAFKKAFWESILIVTLTQNPINDILSNR